MTLYIGVDFHPHQQTVAWCEQQTGETKTCTLFHNTEAVRRFYQALPPAIVGLEASGNASWFENLLAECQHQLWVGNPVLIRARARSRHKSDKRDAELILELLLKDEFPALWRRSAESTQVLEMLRLRLHLVQQRTQIYNRLQALAHDLGLPKGRIKTLAMQQQLAHAPVTVSQQLRRHQLLAVLESFNTHIAEVETWLQEQTQDPLVRLLLTQKGVGYLTALATVHTLGDVTRFDRLSKQVVAFAGLDPVEKSSAGKKQFGGVSKAGSPLLRFLLGQAAHIAARYDPRLKAFHKRLGKKKPQGVAKTATARKLLVKLAIMLRDKITAAEFDERGRTVGNARENARSAMTVL
jgi:transposase